MVKRRIVPAVLAALLIAVICTGCTEKDTRTEAPPMPEVETVFSTDRTDLTSIGWKAADFYYDQFMAEDIPRYWHITKHATLSCELIAGDEREFVVSVTSFIETDGAGFLVGQGIPNDEDINNGGDCPDVQRQIRIKALGDGQYEIVGIGTGGYTQGLAPIGTGNGVDSESESVSASVDRTDLDACVSDVIFSTTAGFTGGDFAAEAHTVLKTVERGSETTVYAMAMYMEFSFADGELTEEGGCHIPVAVTFTKNDAGEYILKEYWTPLDGSGYGPSIEEKFIADIYEDALDTQKYAVAHIQSCYAQAVAYGHVDTDAMITGLLETIVSSPAHMSASQAYIDAHVGEYRQLIYLGEYTLRYCFALFQQGGQTGLEGHIMAAVCRDILGEAGDTGLPAGTGQEWYGALPQSVKDQYR
jgi:hypothetical protein